MSAFENLLVASMFGAQRTTRDAYEHCNAILEDCSLADKANQACRQALTLLDRKRLELARARRASLPKCCCSMRSPEGLTEEGRGCSSIWFDR